MNIHLHQEGQYTPVGGTQVYMNDMSSSIAEMGDRLATIDRGWKVGAAVPLFVGESWVLI